MAPAWLTRPAESAFMLVASSREMKPANLPVVQASTFDWLSILRRKVDKLNFLERFAMFMGKA